MIRAIVETIRDDTATLIFEPERTPMTLPLSCLPPTIREGEFLQYTKGYFVIEDETAVPEA